MDAIAGRAIRNVGVAPGRGAYEKSAAHVGSSGAAGAHSLSQPVISGPVLPACCAGGITGVRRMLRSWRWCLAGAAASSGSPVMVPPGMGWPERCGDDFIADQHLGGACAGGLAAPVKRNTIRPVYARWPEHLACSDHTPDRDFPPERRHKQATKIISFHFTNFSSWRRFFMNLVVYIKDFPF